MKEYLFRNDLSDFSACDLVTLANVVWRDNCDLIYERSVPEKASGGLDELEIAKSIAAFANADGGWIIWGIDARKSGKERIADCGIGRYVDFENQIKSISLSMISPMPMFNMKELQCGKLTTFIIQVQKSPVPPYTLNNGEIYQWKNHEVTLIQDGWEVERLIRKKQIYMQKVDDFCQSELIDINGSMSSDKSYFELYLFPNSVDDFEFPDFNKPSFLRELSYFFYDRTAVSTDWRKVGNVFFFNSIFPTGNSLVIRYLNTCNLSNKAITLELFKNGALKLSSAFAEFDLASDKIYANDRYKGNPIIEYLLDYCTQNKYDLEKCIFLDINNPIIILLLILAKWKDLLQRYNYGLEFVYRIKLINVLGKSLFIDSPMFLDALKLNNIPFSPKKNIEIPKFTDGNFLPFRKDSLSFLYLTKDILNYMGLPNWDVKDIENAFVKQAKHLLKD